MCYTSESFPVICFFFLNYSSEKLHIQIPPAPLPTYFPKAELAPVFYNASLLYLLECLSATKREDNNEQTVRSRLHLKHLHIQYAESNKQSCEPDISLNTPRPLHLLSTSSPPPHSPGPCSLTSVTVQKLHGHTPFFSSFLLAAIHFTSPL